MKNQRAVLLIVFLIMVAIAAWWAIPRLIPHSFHGTILPSPSLAKDFRLTSHTGQQLRLSDFRGKMVVLYFGYTFCPDVCPATLAELSRALDLLGKDSHDVQVIMVSVDPERDTPSKLADYVAHFDPSFLGVTGTQEEIAKIATQYGIFFEKNEGSTATGYLVDHTATQLVVDKKGYLKLLFPYNTKAEDIAEDLKYLITH